MFLYPARLSADEADVTVTFRDIPEALTSGATREEAIEMAADALALATFASHRLYDSSVPV